MSEQEIPANLIEKIRQHDNDTLSSIYKEVYPMVEKYVLTNNGDQADAQDVFQDAFYLMLKKIEDSAFELSSKISTFLFGISKNLWLKRLTKKSIDIKSYEAELSFDELSESDADNLDTVKGMHHCIELLGEPCKTIIVEFYFLQTSMKEIAKKLHYTNANNAKNQKYKCFMRLKKLLTNK